MNGTLNAAPNAMDDNPDKFEGFGRRVLIHALLAPHEELRICQVVSTIA